MQNDDDDDTVVTLVVAWKTASYVHNCSKTRIPTYLLTIVEVIHSENVINEMHPVK